MSLNPLICAACNGQTDVVLALIDKGADVNASDDCGNTALIWAVREGYRKMVSALIAKGANVNACNWAGDTADLGGLQRL